MAKSFSLVFMPLVALVSRRVIQRSSKYSILSDEKSSKLSCMSIYVYSRARNLKEILVPTRLPVIKDRTDSNLPPGCYKCKAKVCDICKNYLAVGNKFKSLSTKDTFRMKHRMDCNAINVYIPYYMHGMQTAACRLKCQV